MLEDFKDSVNSVLKERLVSPVFGAFAISWSIINYELIYYVLTVDSKVPVQTRLSFVKENYIDIDYNFWQPLAFSLLMLLLFPVSSGLVAIFKIWIDSIVKKLSFKVQKTIPIPHDDAIALYERIEKEEERRDRLFKEKEAKIIALNTQLEEGKGLFELTVSNLRDSFGEKINMQLHQIEELHKSRNEEIKQRGIAEKELRKMHRLYSAKIKILESIKPQLFPDKLSYLESVMNMILNQPFPLNVFFTLINDMPLDEKVRPIPAEVTDEDSLQYLEERGLIVFDEKSYSLTQLGEQIRTLLVLSDVAFVKIPKGTIKEI
ncbi:hypothetical protein TH63_19645 [Rufibacter radiotolerans]|uniref:Uncharacterized protein n=1 Tax=Rufibacter radiotolerans TaxID=1379910 RepID=A0A0H4VPY0_9BACT|nr:hypothetical protein [Rufibacter radiotolerans]AKQ47363.1 hypothetical protein TH63_19645 [Rufibacter radiotolerans]